MKKIILILTIVGIMILIMMNSCSLLIDGYTRNVGYNSICWEDNDHILVYANIEAYDDYTTIGGGARNYIWVGGEIWRIDVNTGEKELLMRKKESEYSQQIEAINIIKTNDNYFISGTFNTYQLREDFNGWDSIGNYAYPIFSDDGNTAIVAYIPDNYEDVYQIWKYNLINNTYENIYIPNEPIKSLDYDYNQNLLLINNIKLVDLNTGEETILIEDGETINGYSVDIYSDRYGQLTDDYILIDFDTYNSHEYSKVFINIDSLTDKRLVYGLRGKQSPNGDKYAYERVNSNRIEIYNNVGYLIREILFDNDKI